MSPGSTTGTGVPVEPDVPTARRWVTEELADEAYAAAEPGLVTRFITWLVETLGDLEVAGSPGIGLAVLLAVLAIVLVVAVRTAGSWRRTARSVAAPVLGDTVTTADSHRALARSAEQDHRWDDAVREWFRAVVRGCEERTLLTDRPGRTADEAAQEAAVPLPDLAAELVAGARRFDEVTYGGRRATPGHAEQLRRLDAAVTAARPRLDAAETVPAVPGG